MDRSNIRTAMKKPYRVVGVSEKKCSLTICGFFCTDLIQSAEGCRSTGEYSGTFECEYNENLYIYIMESGKMHRRRIERMGGAFCITT